MQRFEVGVSDAAGEVGGPAVFTCDVPPTVASYVTVTSWSVDGRTIRPGTRPGALCRLCVCLLYSPVLSVCVCEMMSNVKCDSMNLSLTEYEMCCYICNTFLLITDLKLFYHLSYLKHTQEKKIISTVNS